MGTTDLDGGPNQLVRRELVRRSPYLGVELTPRGITEARQLLCHHPPVERYLGQALGMPADQAHTEAERLEHHISEHLEATIENALAFLRSPGDAAPAAE